jgi:phage tail P2-like protein
MKTLDSLKIKDLLPSSLASSQVVQDVAAACDVPLSAVTERMSDLLIYSRIDDLDEATVDDLAWQFHVDFYDIGLTLGQKRDLVKSAIKDHKYKGTTWAVKSVLKPIRGDVVLQDWYQYGGMPYHFRVNGFGGAMVSADELTHLVAAIYSVKNVRSWLDGVGFNRSVTLTKRVTGVLQLHKEVTIPLPSVTAPDVALSKYQTGALALHKEVVING